jgi:hypothetical protein
MAFSGMVLAQMTPEADKAYQAYLFDKQEADAVYKEAMNKAKEKCVKVLKKEQDALLVKKDLAGANKIQAKIDELNPSRIENSGKINLLSLINPQKDTITGNWSLKDGELISDGSRDARIQIPYQPPEEYDLHISFTCTEGNEYIAMILANPNHQFIWLMGAWNNTIFGFHLVDNKEANHNPTTVKHRLENNKKYFCNIKVRKNMISVILDDKVIIEYKTDFNNFSKHPVWTLRDDKALGVGSTERSIIFHTIEVVEISGCGTITK